MKLTQKHFFKGSQELELVDDHINVRIKAPFKGEEKLTVMLTVLDPEPVIGKSDLHFRSRVNGEPLIRLLLGKPDTEQFNAFVKLVKQRAMEEYQLFAGLRPTGTAEFDDTAHEHPPVFPEMATTKRRFDLDAKRIDESIDLLKRDLDEAEIEPFLSALRQLAETPDSPSSLAETIAAFNRLGAYQGAVLTYAPYVGVVLADNPGHA